MAAKLLTVRFVTMAHPSENISILPRNEEGCSTTPSKRSSAPVSYEQRVRNSRILLVDDVVANLTLLENVLRRLGYQETKCVTDPRDVFVELDDWKPDLIVLDLAM